MQFHSIHPTVKNKKRMQVGRGGKRGKTSGRGTKGMDSRAGHKKRPEMRDIIKRLPKLRGYSFNSIHDKPVTVSLSDIDQAFKAKEIVSPASLAAKKVVETFNGKYLEIKVLSNGDITKALTFKNCLVSSGAKTKIEKAGGTVA